ncbi:MAG: hypothetical protein RJA91_120 [Pseudomonadota bacterium]|jgi:hypothetical protein
MSEQKKQAELLASGFLNQIGEKYDIVQNGELPVVEGILARYGKLFNEEVQKQLEKSGAIATGKIGELAVPVINKFGNDYELLLGYNKNNPAAIYYKYVNKGVKGYAANPVKAKKIISDTPYKFETPYVNKKMATSILKWFRTGKGAAMNETQTKKLSATQRKSKRLKNIVNKADNLKTLAYATSAAIKRDGLRSTLYFDNAIKKVFDKGFFDTMAVALGKDVQIQIRQIGNKLENNGYNN